MSRDDIIEILEWHPSHVEHGKSGLLSRIERVVAVAVAAEREACAKLCDDKAKETFSGQCQVWGDYFARAIRARGQQ